MTSSRWSILGTEVNHEEVKEAWLKSVDKWKRIASLEKIDGGTRDCAFCQTFHAFRCLGCPVFLAVNIHGCLRTPYNDFAAEFGDVSRPPRRYAEVGEYYDKMVDQYVAAATEELEFIEGLRPIVENWPEKMKEASALCLGINEIIDE